jgi:hypothetical protein
VIRALATAAVAAALSPASAMARGRFEVGAASVDFTPPRAGQLAGDPADCASGADAVFSGRRLFAFEEPYVDRNRSGEYDLGEPYLDCNADGRWDGNFVGGGSDAPRMYTHVLDDVGARAMVVSNRRRTIAVEVLDNEGLFNTYIERIRARVAADGYPLDGIFISSTHDESAPDTIGLYGVTPVTSSANPYFADYLVKRSAKAIERAYDAMRPARIRYAQAIEPANLRQCWSSYPYTDNQLMPTLQAVDARSGQTIVTLASVGQHTESLGFNPSTSSDPMKDEKLAISSDWPHFFRAALEQQYGGVGIEMAGAVGSVETPEVFSGAISRTPQRFVDESHPAGCRTEFDAAGDKVPLGYETETRALGEDLAGAVEQALATGARPSHSSAVWGERADVCIPLSNLLFVAAAAGGVFGDRAGYAANCTIEVPPLPEGTTAGNEILSQVAAFRIGDGEFVSLPGEVFPFTYFRGFQGPEDMPFPQYPLPPWPIPHMHTPFRFLDGLGEDMVGYIFPRGNGVGVPGEDPLNNPSADSTDRFGCGHSDDSESANSRAGDLLGSALVKLLDKHAATPESVKQGRYVLPDGTLSRDPLGGPEIKCNVDRTFTAGGPALAVWTPDGVIAPTAWIDLYGRRQAAPDRNTRGYVDADGHRVWLDVFPDMNAPARVDMP